jgi:REP element-mobilizing transposase RayT
MTWGGRRPGAGRKRSPTSGVSHIARPALAARFPVHVALKLRPEVGNVRNARCHQVIAGALAAAHHEGFRVCHYSVQAHHIHLIVEAKDQPALSRGMQGLMIRMARGLNRVQGRCGKVFADRYFARILRTPREVRNCVAYVLNNTQRHRFGKGPGLRKVEFDPYSSAAAFDGWREELLRSPVDSQSAVVARPQTWLLNRGWRRHGLLIPAYVPQWGNSWGP